MHVMACILGRFSSGFIAARGEESRLPSEDRRRSSAVLDVRQMHEASFQM